MSRSLRQAIAAAALLCGAPFPAPAPSAEPAAASPSIVRPASPEPLYQDLGPGISRLFLSAPYADNGRLVWACGTKVVAKIDALTFDVVATLRRPGSEPDDSGRRERRIAALDAAGGEALDGPADEGKANAPGLASPLLDADGRLLVPEERAIVAYGDAEPGARLSGIRSVQRFEMPASIPGRLTGLTLTKDGPILAATSAGSVIALARGFSRLTTVRLPHAPAAGTEAFVSGAAVADDRGGVFVASSHHLHRVAWDGSNLSVAPEQGAWSEPLPGGAVPGAAPVLLEAGADRLVAMLSGASASERGESRGKARGGEESPRTVIAMWRDDLPGNRAGSKAGALPRIAATASAGRVLTLTGGRDRGGSGLLVSTGDAANSGDAAALRKLAWDAQAGALATAWTSRDAPIPIGGAVLSSDGKVVRYIGLRDGRPALVGLDWTSGAVTLERGLGGARFHPRGAIPILDPGGALLSGCLYGVMRLEIGK